MLLNIGFYSYSAAFLAYLVVSVLLLVVWKNRALSLSSIVATVATTAWAAIAAVLVLLEDPPLPLLRAAEVLRNGSWLFLLLSIYGARLRGTNHLLGSRRWIPWFLVGIAGAVLILIVAPVLGTALGFPAYTQVLFYSLWLTMSLSGLLVVENIYRNSSEEERWWTQYLCLALGFMFAYDFFMYAGALLLQQLDTALLMSRGFAVALTAPLVAIAAARSRDLREGRKLSQHVVFHTATLLAGGVYLILMAIIGYFVSYLGGSWSGVLEITFFSAAFLLLLGLLFSSRMRANSRVWLSKNFFSYKYDYRREWYQFSELLAEGDVKTPQAIVQAMAGLANCRAGLLLATTADGSAELVAQWCTEREPELSYPESGYSEFLSWMQSREWIIDVEEWRQKPAKYQDLDMPAELADMPGQWLIIPLMFKGSLEAILALERLQPFTSLNWEDYDLIKAAARQAAVHLKQYQASQALVEMRQFEAFNRLSAFVIHDLKNILAEQSLIISNAERHRGNPAFFADVIDTVGDSVERMTNLMSQMNGGLPGGEIAEFDLGQLLRKVVREKSNSEPRPRLDYQQGAVRVRGDEGRLRAVFGHLLQNAKEATPKHGEIQVRLMQEESMAVVEIEDNGSGMSKGFIRERLFTPFDTTKGLTGMGIGVFESREVVRSMGGSVRITSTEGMGTCCRIVLPCLMSDIMIKTSAEDEAGG